MSNQISSSNSSSISQVFCDTISLKDLLLKGLSIPAYQRGYCWRRENIVKLLDDIYNHKKISKASFHLGTIIVKQRKNKELSIIDGQQRLITLSILIYAIGKNKNCKYVPKLLRNNISKTENVSKEHIGYIVRALKTIELWVIGKEEFLPYFFNEVKVCLVTIPYDKSEDLAYRFFNATNTTGEPLSDYDLLKTHHLRYVPDCLAGFIAKRWDLMSEDEQKQEELFNYMLYRLRSWSWKNKPDYEPNKNGKRLLFEHYSVKYDHMNIETVVHAPVQYNSIFNGGIDFFKFVEDYRVKLERFECIEYIKKLENYLCPQGNRVLYETIKSITFLFYLKFDEYYLSEALFCISYRISQLRNEDRVKKEFIYTRDIFQDLVQIIDASTTPSVLFGHCLKSEYRYISKGITGIRADYWSSLKELFEILPNNKIFPVQDYSSILILESENEQKK